MKQLIFSLADILTLLTAIAYGYICFLGYYFCTLGDTSHSLIMAIMIVILLAGTALLAKILKRTKRNFKNNLIFEISVLVIFTLLMGYFAYKPFNHYFKVSDQQNTILHELKQSIKQSQSMFNEYEQYAFNRLKLYKDTLKKSTDNDTLFKVKNVPIAKQINHMVSTLQDDLFPTNYTDTINKNGIKEIASIWLSEASSTLNTWKPVGVVQVMIEVEKNSNNWANKLTQISNTLSIHEQTSYFTYPSPPILNVKIIFTALGRPTLLSITLTIVAYALMLLSWFVTKRSSKVFGTSSVAHYEVEL